METKRTVIAVPWTTEEDQCIKEIAAQRPNATRYYQRESFKQHHPNTQHTDGAIEGRFSMVAPKWTSKKWSKSRCRELVMMKQNGMSDKEIARIFTEEGMKVTSLGVASQCSAMRCRGGLKKSSSIKRAYTREIDGVRQTKMDLSNTMQIPPDKTCLQTSAPAQIAEATRDDSAKSIEAAALEKYGAISGRISNLTAERVNLAQNFLTTFNRIFE